MSKALIKTLNRGRYFAASMLMLAVQFMPISSFWNNTASAADTGFSFPSSTNGDINWGEGSLGVAENAFADDGMYAQDDDHQHEQGFTGFNLSVPASSTIDGIQVNIEANSTIAGCDMDTRLSWNGGAANTHTSRKSVDLTPVDTIHQLGGASDNWGRNWEVGDLSSDNFVVKVRFEGNGGCSDAIFSVDYIAVKVFYTPPVPNEANPALAQACGLDIALVIDRSGSINATEMGQMKTALNAFVDALDETPTQFSVTRFNTTAAVAQSFTNNDSNLVTNAINATTTGGTFDTTNWEDALIKANSTFDPRPGPTGAPNLILFATDGDPTTSNTVGGTDTSQPNAHLAPAIAQANIIKGQGTRIVPIGIGLGGADSTNRLKQISGPTDTGPIQNRDVIITDNFVTLASDLAAWVEATCGGTITTTKLIDHDNNPAIDPIKGEGWDFLVNGNTYTTDSNGQTIAVGVEAGTYSVTETVKPGYEIVDASCKISNKNDQPVGNWVPGSDTVTGIVVSNIDAVACTFINRPTTGTLIVEKVVVGGPSEGKPQDFSFSVNDGSSTAFESDGNNSVTLSEGTQYSVTETYLPNDYVPEYSQGCDGVIAASKTSICTITNTWTPDTKLTLKKVVVNNGNDKAKANDWKLKARGDDKTVINEAGSPLVKTNKGSYAKTKTVDVKAGVSYVLSEYGGPSGYAASQWSCTGGNLQGNVVTLEPGEDVTCTVTNTLENGSIKGYKYEAGTKKTIPGWKIFIDKNGNGRWDKNEPVTVTNQNGQYSFNNLTPNKTYTVCEVSKQGWTRVLPVKSDCQNVKVKPGQKSWANFTNFKNGKVTGYKIEDMNGNGSWDDGDEGLNDWEITLYKKVCIKNPEVKAASFLGVENSKNVSKDCNHQYVEHKTTTTRKDSNGKAGYYKFVDLAPGKYKVCEVQQEGWLQTSPNWTHDGCYEIDIDKSGKVAEYNHFGNFRLGEINGFKFNDANKNSLYDEDEEKLSGWEITLNKLCKANGEVEVYSIAQLKVAPEYTEGCKDTVVATTTTDESGYYEFGGLEPGKYSVCETQKDGWVQTYPSETICHEVEVNHSGQVTEANFGNYEEPGQVLSASTPEASVLASTGTTAIMATIAALFITVTAGAVAISGKRN